MHYLNVRLLSLVQIFDGRDIIAILSIHPIKPKGRPPDLPR